MGFWAIMRCSPPTALARLTAIWLTCTVRPLAVSAATAAERLSKGDGRHADAGVGVLIQRGVHDGGKAALAAADENSVRRGQVRKGGGAKPLHEDEVPGPEFFRGWL